MTVDNELHPLDERYIEAYGLREGGAIDDADGGTLRCPLCAGVLVPTHHQRRGHRYYKHRSEEDTARCPLTTTNYQLERFQIGTHVPDPHAARAHRAQFLFNWKRHFRIARHTAPALTLERFTALVKYADVMNLWAYPLLDQRDLPYVLLVLAGFMAEHRKGDVTTWTRFWFDGRIRSANDLWRSGAPEARLYRVIYRDAVRTPFPTSSEIIRWERIERVERIADITSRGVGRAEMRTFEQFLENDKAVQEE
ncbi:hypothetical protein KZJ38_24450 [Paraburkholderia edwinii]|uniref:Competence protein CoiA-like protein n=1 Tax=Paraburkholderia edwinii TaxID=2861782 RepID=A0ABX8UV37_9BURK|nr:hypothetical protein [Paraburkholderia edwinii]QYD72842.1 hypothetical protein KZJ38_24450 [Paraburkholderia edwinii]